MSLFNLNLLILVHVLIDCLVKVTTYDGLNLHHFFFFWIALMPFLYMSQWLDFWGVGFIIIKFIVRVSFIPVSVYASYASWCMHLCYHISRANEYLIGYQNGTLEKRFEWHDNKGIYILLTIDCSCTKRKQVGTWLNSNEMYYLITWTQFLILTCYENAHKSHSFSYCVCYEVKMQINWKCEICYNDR